MSANFNAVIYQHKIFNIRGELRSRVPLTDHTSWHVGGEADYVYWPADLEDLQNFLPQIPIDIPILWLGLGSNSLIRDGGVRGVVIITQGRLNNISKATNFLEVEAGVSCAKIARFAASKGWDKCEFFAGIPGTMGGALAMNAGAFGGDTWSLVDSVITINRQGHLRLRKKNEFEISYRKVLGLENEEGFVKAFLNPPLIADLSQLTDTRTKISSLLKKRNETQPTGVFSGGSVFKNPEADFAGRLIEVAGLKGTKIGGAEISNKHANFIVNFDNARASDIEKLINLVQSEVLTQFSIKLEPEVKIIGEPLILKSSADGDDNGK